MRSLEGLIRVAVKHGQECAARMSEETTNGKHKREKNLSSARKEWNVVERIAKRGGDMEDR